MSLLRATFFYEGMKPIVGITIGDIAGIGIEVLLRSFASKELFSRCIPLVFGPIEILRERSSWLGIQVPLYPIKHISEVCGDVLNVLPTEDTLKNITIKPTQYPGITLSSIELGVQALKEKQVYSLVTNPIDKKVIQNIIPTFSGHTDYLAAILGKKSLMIMSHPEVCIALVTNHLPLSEIASQIKEKLIIEKIATFVRSLEVDFDIPNPKIAVLGLNPHAGDPGAFGKEEKVITEVIRGLNSQKVLVEGAYPGDGFFGSKKYKQFDGVMAMYHDQGLMPFKMLAEGSGVNYTAGLGDLIRTSPAHGTAYDIAKRGVANPDSFREAVLLSLKLKKNILANLTTGSK